MASTSGYQSILNQSLLDLNVGDLAISGLTADRLLQYSSAGQLASATVNSPLEFKSGALSLDTTGLITASYPLEFTEPNLALLYNATNLKLTANSLNTIQNIATTSSPTFAGLRIDNQVLYMPFTNGDDSVLISSVRSSFPSNLHSLIIGRAGELITTGSRNVLLGIETGQNITTGSYNILIGDNLGNSIVTGNYNCIIGINSGNVSDVSNAVQIGLSGCSASDCVAIGSSALDGTTGVGNVAIGSNAGYSNSSGIYNVAIGDSAMGGIGTAAQSYNTAVGHAAMRNIISCLRTTAIGDSAGYLNETGTDNVFIGYRAGYYEMGSSKLYISNSNTTTPLIYGDFATQILTVNNNLRVSGLTINRLLSTDANKQLTSLAAGTIQQYLRGDMSWQNLATDARNAISADAPLSYNAFTGRMSITGSFEPAITAGTTAQYWRGDKTWQTLNQAAVAGLTTASSPTFTGLNLSGLTASRMLLTDASKNLISATTGNSLSISGSTIDTIQDIRTSATPQFARLGIGGASPANQVISQTASLTAAASSNIFGINNSGTLGVTSTGNNCYGYYSSPTYSVPASYSGSIYTMQIDAGGKSGTGTPAVAFGLHCVSPNVGATNAVGVYTDSLAVGVNPWANRTNANGRAYIAGNTGIGLTPQSHARFSVSSNLLRVTENLQYPAFSGGNNEIRNQWNYMNTANMNGGAIYTYIGIHVGETSAANPASTCDRAIGVYAMKPVCAALSANNYAIYCENLVVGTNPLPGAACPTNGIYCNGGITLGDTTLTKYKVVTGSTAALTYGGSAAVNVTYDYTLIGNLCHLTVRNYVVTCNTSAAVMEFTISQTEARPALTAPSVLINVKVGTKQVVGRVLVSTGGVVSVSRYDGTEFNTFPIDAVNTQGPSYNIEISYRTS